MARKKIQAPPDFQCPYEHACPYLEGLSTQWVWECYQRDPRERDAMHREIDQLRAELIEAYQLIGQLQTKKSALEVQLQQLHRKQFKANRPKAAAPPEVAPEGSPKKRGAPQGHPPWTRAKPAHTDKTVSVPAPEQCPHCHSHDLLPWEEHFEHLQEDIVLCPRTQVVCFDHQLGWCPICRRPVMQAAPGEMLGSYIGPVAKSAAIYLRYGIGLSYRKVRTVLTDLFGLSMVPASVVGFDQAAARKGEALYEDLHQKIQASAHLHADETSWRVDGNNHWLWYAGHEDLAYFHIDQHRSAEAAAKLISPQFTGALNTDDYSAYNPLEVKTRQSCLAHPLRQARDELKAIESNGHTVDQASLLFLHQIQDFLKECCQLGEKLRTGDTTLPPPDKIKEDLQKRLRRLCIQPLSWPAAEQLRVRLRKQRKHLFTFVDHPEVQPTNNQAEQSLRSSVIMRKVTFGNRSETGAQRQALLTSLLLTAQRQQRDPRHAFEQLFTQPLARAQRAFYREQKRRPSKRHSSKPGDRQQRKCRARRTHRKRKMRPK